MSFHSFDKNRYSTRIVRDSDYRPAAAPFMQEKGQVLKKSSRKIKDIVQEQILTSIKGHNCYKLDLVNMKVYIKFGKKIVNLFSR